MSYVPILLVQQILPEDIQSIDVMETKIVAIAVYANESGVPLTVVTRRLFDGDKQFYFPTEVTEGAAKTRIVYQHTLAQWRELLESLTLPSAPDALKQLMIPMFLYLKEKYPAVLAGIEYDQAFDPAQFAEILPVQ